MFEIQLSISRVQYTAVEIILEELGAISLSLQDAENNPVFVEEVGETPIWKNIFITAFFDKDIDVHHLQNTIEDVLACPIELSKRSIENKDYQQTWMKDISPMRFGDRLWVCPSWCNCPDPFAINIKLDPGLAFGTGTHPTTALCLEWLAEHNVMNETVIDFGCGSGILAIAAYYLGAKTILAIDHDMQASQATRANAIKNFVPENQFIVSTADNLNEHSCDLLIANILLRPLVNLEPQFAKSVVPAGTLLLSGILEQQLEELTQAYQPHFSIDLVYSKKEWLLVEASRKLL